ncbi:MAG: hypothetical protein C4541_07780 [Candidatus Auribacter fodinae]|jgi:Sec-independent protein translocase protein TatA|uniref:Uncharacterized protein n=1 Tax=Candidatus Auribacter fodinae TaxID=2093366 RepID=A0A3A4R253_9BACT|nr:MAG: hypothetical protein C4541_07780 [Candidatus Auribacter fodinae]
MNAILNKILFYLSVVAFSLTFYASFRAGASVLHCLLRGSIALVAVGAFGALALRGMFRQIAFELAEYEKRMKEGERREKQAENDRADELEHEMQDETQDQMRDFQEELDAFNNLKS